MKDLLDFIKAFDLHTIIIVAIAFWWLNGNVLSKIDKLDQKITKLDERVTDVDRRLSRIEGIMSVKNVCMIPEIQTHQEKSNKS